MNKSALIKYINFIFITVFLILLIWMIYYISTHSLFNLEVFNKKKIAVIHMGGIYEDAYQGLKKGLFERGYSEGKNVVYLVQVATSSESLKLAISNLAIKEPDVVFSVGQLATAGIKDAVTEGTPIVFSAVGDPIQAGFVNGYSASESFLTGYADFVYETAGKRLEIFKRTLPSLRRVMVFYDSENMVSRSNLPSLRFAASALGIELIEKEAKDAKAVELELETNGRNGADGLFIYPEPAISGDIGMVLAKANELGLPSMAYASGMIEKGATLSFGMDLYEEGKECAVLMEKIIKGSDPKVLPVLTPEKFEFILNSAEAKKMGLVFDPEAVKLADKIVE